MPIKIIQKNKPDLQVCKMNCDKELAPHLNDYEMFKHFNAHGCNCIIGRPGSGKTNLIYSLFKTTKGKNKLLSGVYSTIYIFQPKASRRSMKDSIFEELPDDQKFEDLTFDNLYEVYSRIEKDAEDGYTSCILFDDMGSYLKNKETLKIFRMMMMNHRHLHLSMFFMIQNWYSSEKTIRRLWHNIIIFKVSTDELNNILSEVTHIKKAETIKEIDEAVFDKKFNYLFINVNNNLFYKNGDLIEFEK